MNLKVNLNLSGPVQAARVMSAPLSYFSTLEEVISTSDGDLRQGFGYLAPDTVMEYVMYLRDQLRAVQKGKEAADNKIARLKAKISEKDASLTRMMSALRVGDTAGTDIMPPPPSLSGYTSTVPNLTYTGYSQEQGCSSSFTQPSSVSLNPNSPKIDEVHQVRLQEGFVVRATFVYMSRTDKFTINLLKADQKFYIFHLDFRPYPNGPNEIVMNTKPSNWEQEIRAKLPKLVHCQLFNVTIECEKHQFRVKINDKYIEKTFPYRYPLKDVAVIKLIHGSLGNKWIALSWGPGPAPSKALDQSSSYNPDVHLPPINAEECLGERTLKPGMKISAKAFFKKGTSKFTINLLKATGFYIFHLDFRPYPHGSVIVMNTNPNRSWETEVRAELPHLVDGQTMDVIIECGQTEFKVKVNGNYIEKRFPYRYPLKDVKKLSVAHGNNGNKWISLNYLNAGNDAYL